jgi:hypothetical protein
MFMLQVGVLEVTRDTKTNFTVKNCHCEEVLKNNNTEKCDTISAADAPKCGTPQIK